MAKKMSDKAASGHSNAAAKPENNHHHRHHQYFFDRHKAQPAPASRLECVAGINDCADAFGGMGEKMSDKSASGRSNAAANPEGNNHQHQHHHHHQYFFDQHKAQMAPADRLECSADIDDCAGAFIERFHRQLEMQRLQSRNRKHKEVPIGSRE